MFPVIPDSLLDLSVEDLRQLRADIRAEIKRVVDDTENLSRERLQEANDAREGVQRIDDELQRRSLAEYAEEEEETEETEEDGAREEEGSSGEASEAGESGSEETTEPTENQEEDELGNEAPPSTSLATGSQPDDTTPAPSSRIVISDRSLVKGLHADSPASFDHLSEALVAKSQRIINSPEKINVADIEFSATDAQKLTGDKGELYQKLTQTIDDDLVADLCGPTDEIVALDNPMVDTARHVTTSLPRYTGDASKFSVHQAPTYSDIDWTLGEDNPETAIGHWNSDHDAAYAGDPDNAATKGCLEVQCVDDVGFEIKAVFSCIQVPNLFAMSFPQLVSLYQRIGLAAHSQYADDLALEALNAADAITWRDGDGTDNPGFDVVTRLRRLLVRARADYINRERLNSVNFDVWLPQAFGSYIQAALMSRRTTDGSLPSGSMAQVNQIFAEQGFTPHWYQDPSFQLSIDAGDNVWVERDYAEMTFRAAPRGKFRFVDQGRLTVGVMGSGGFRDAGLVSSNRFRVFFETFETVIDTMSAPAVDLHLEDLCNNGVQVADETIECLGLGVS